MATQTIEVARRMADRQADWTVYDETERIKVVRFNAVGTVADVLADLGEAWDRATARYGRPLVQARAVLPLADEDRFLAAMVAAGRPGARAWVAGRIPFRVDGERLALYTVQVEAQGRPSYASAESIDHATALRLGYLKRRAVPVTAAPDGIRIHAIELVDGRVRGLLSEAPAVRLEVLARELARLHRLAFAYPHDPAQQSAEGVLAILAANPLVFATDADGMVIAALYLERDRRFTIGGYALAEVTLFTHPSPAYRRHGLGGRLLAALVALLRTGGLAASYGGAPAIVFAEAVRDTCLPLTIAHGFEAAATEDLRIAGDLGDAYTAIGPASPGRGFMPMGLSYLVDPRIAGDAA